MPITRAAVLLLAASALGAQARDTTPAYVLRGRQVDARQRVFASRTAAVHDSIADALRRWAPDLVPSLEPPPPIATGYQLLPRIVADPVTQPPVRLQQLSYSWRWSETLMGNESRALDSLAAVTRGLTGAPRRTLLDSLVTGFRRFTDRKRLVDADVNYNWLWQATIARAPDGFLGTQRLVQALLDRQSIDQLPSDIGRQLAFEVLRVVPLRISPIVRVDSAAGRRTLTLPIITDIQDSAFLAAFRSAVEDNWRATDNGVSYAVRLDLRSRSATSLYCGATRATGCAPPARGAAVDLQSHIARFPADTAVLTTGAGSTHVTAGRAIVVSPHDLTRRTAAHEFGHLLGFRDGYLRGAVAAGADGWIITELVVDPRDIMGEARTGSVSADHFVRLFAALGERR